MSVFQSSLEKLNTRLGDVEVSPQSVISVMKYAMEIIELSELKGGDQKDMAIRLVKAVVTESSIEEGRKKVCLDIIESGALAQTIDLVIEATKGNININQVVNAAKKFSPLLCGC